MAMSLLHIGHIGILILYKIKFEPLATLVQGMTDILIVSETKIDDSFPTNQFMMRYALDKSIFENFLPP